MTATSDPNNISGWLLPDGSWYAAEDWWHIAALYDLRDAGFQSLCTEEFAAIMKRGDEAEIRDYASKLGFVKISRNLIDGCCMTIAQLHSLQELLELCDPDFEMGVIQGESQTIKHIPIAKLLKLKTPTPLFS